MIDYPDGRVVPLISIRRYFKGNGDPVLDGRVFAFYDILAETWPLGSGSRSALGETLLEFQPEIGLVCRPSLTYQDTRLTEFATSGGTWDESRPGWGPGRKYRLRQVDTTANLAWAAQSYYWLPAQPELAFTVQTLATPPDHDSVTYPPYVRIEFGGRPAVWGLEWSGIYGGRLVRRVGGLWTPQRDLPALEPDAATGEALVLLRCLRGRIGVSTNRGRNYSWWGDDESPLAVAAGPVLFRGIGQAAAFGVQQLVMATGVWTSAPRPTFTTAFSSSPTLTARGSALLGTSLTLADASVPANGIAQYTATLTPTTITGTGMTWAMHRSPELYAVTFRYGVSRSIVGNWGFYETPWDGAVYSLDIEKPLELDGATGTLSVRLDPDTPFQWDSGRWPAIQVRAGWVTDTGSESWTTVFTGYAERIPVRSDLHRDVRLELRLHNRSIRFREAKYSELDRFPYGGFTVNQALDLILDSEGLQVTDRVWHPIGDYVTLPSGSPENPGFWPAADDTKWQWMLEIAAAAGLDIGVTDAGIFVTLPPLYVEPWVSAVWEATPASDLGAAVLSIENSLDSLQSATCVLEYGVDQAGNRIMAFAVDLAAEMIPASSRFSPWRRTEQRTAQGTVSLGVLLARAQRQALIWFGNKYDASLRVPWAPTLSRGQRARLEGEGVVGIAAYDQWGVLTLRQHVEHDPSFALKTQTNVVLRRLN